MIFVPHRKHINEPPRPVTGIALSYVRFEVFTTVTMKNVVFWDVTPCGFVRTDVSEELRSVRVTRIGELGTFAVTSNQRTLTLFLVHLFLSS
jgi:hypothetical protein